VLADRYADRLMEACKPEMLARLREHQAQGYEVYLITAGLEPYLESFAQKLGAHLVATRLAIDAHGRYTGVIEGIDSLGEGKVQKLLAVIGDVDSIDWSASYACGDSMSDIPIVRMVGHATAVDPDPALAEYATENGWEVVYTR